MEKAVVLVPSGEWLEVFDALNGLGAPPAHQIGGRPVMLPGAALQEIAHRLCKKGEGKGGASEPIKLQ